MSEALENPVPARRRVHRRSPCRSAAAVRPPSNAADGARRQATRADAAWPPSRIVHGDPAASHRSTTAARCRSARARRTDPGREADLAPSAGPR
ncbi:MAG TPA: hypothetical protein VMR06_13350 [Dokdonella sp.]|uniref:hypothetical protein n=1 Tax=Dokdonella sp. TaxID=2291710 RepID=UPI002BBD0A28|nr:hypothetical protein [Dokdonella sp.]HUD42970.1 hypothetical protein [Dokdonella sp.]